MKGLYINITSIFILISLNSCFLVNNNGYKGLTTTTLAGHIVLNNNNCYVASTLPETIEDDQWALTAVINLETSGDKYVSLCLVESNFPSLFDLPPNFRDIKLTFYASDEVALPNSTNVGSTSEILLFAYNSLNQYQIAELSIFNLSQTCEVISETGELKPGFLLGELDLSKLEKKLFIVARVADCGNFPIGTATNPLVSEKNLPK